MYEILKLKFKGRGSVPNAEYAPKLKYLDILVKTIDISELVGVRCGDRQTDAFYLQSNECV